jgi:hypothetical protein
MAHIDDYRALGVVLIGKGTGKDIGDKPLASQAPVPPVAPALKDSSL